MGPPNSPSIINWCATFVATGTLHIHCDTVRGRPVWWNSGTGCQALLPSVKQATANDARGALRRNIAIRVPDFGVSGDNVLGRLLLMC